MRRRASTTALDSDVLLFPYARISGRFVVGDTDSDPTQSRVGLLRRAQRP